MRTKQLNVLAAITFPFFCLLTIFTGLCIAVAADETPGTVQIRQVKRAPDSVVLVINKTDPSQILVVSPDGKWLSKVRKVTITATIGGDELPQVECLLWDGIFKPTKPKVQSWKLNGIIVADTVEFQKILDDLQEGNFKND